MPSQGVATTYARSAGPHPAGRQSPSFLMIKENDKVDVLTHIVTPRTDLPRKPLLIPPRRRRTKAAQEAGQGAKYPPPPMPEAAARRPQLAGPFQRPICPKRSRAAKPSRSQSRSPPTIGAWCARPTGNPAGCSRGGSRMAIPDEVAQYAEGHRIVSYFSLGSIQDGEREEEHVALDHHRRRRRNLTISIAFASSSGACGTTATRRRTSSATCTDTRRCMLQRGGLSGAKERLWSPESIRAFPFAWRRKMGSGTGGEYAMLGNDRALCRRAALRRAAGPDAAVTPAARGPARSPARRRREQPVGEELLRSAYRSKRLQAVSEVLTAAAAEMPGRSRHVAAAQPIVLFMGSSRTI